jgi:periplasmic divalent cation tolerance protein
LVENFPVTDKIVVLATCGSAEEADKVARSLVDARLAACVNIVPRIRSIYRWKGEVESGEEWLLIVKSRRSLFPLLREEIRKAHSYEVPETIALSVVDGSPDYLQWMEGELRSD